MSTNLVGDFPVSGKIVVITGGGSGIGLAFARLAHSRSARILIGDLKLHPEAESFVSSVPADTVVFAKCDVTSFADLRNLVSESIKYFGAVPDVYVPCAGVFDPKWSNFWDDTEEDGYATFRINSEHPVKFTRLAIKALLGEKKKGVVLLVASTAGLGGNYLASLYCASKWAVVGLARSLAPAEREEGVKVVAICPGVVRSPLWTDRTDGKADDFNYDNIPALTTEDVAGTMLKLVEDGKYQGGTVMMTTTDGEVVVHEGGEQIGATKQAQENAFKRVKTALDKERGVPWK